VLDPVFNLPSESTKPDQSSDPKPASRSAQTARVVVGNVQDLYPGWQRAVQVGFVSVLVTVEKDGVYAIENACPHYQVALSTGRRRGGYVECPWHHWLIDIRTGECMHNPRITASTYEVTVENGAYVVHGIPSVQRSSTSEATF
jgi:nitrite reductase (NADH) small subunit